MEKERDFTGRTNEERRRSEDRSFSEQLNLPGVNLDEAGTKLAEGRVKDAVFRIFALAKVRVDSNTVIDPDYYAKTWEHIRMVREEEFPPEEERKLPTKLYPQYGRHIQMIRANKEEIVATEIFGMVREACLSAYGRAFMAIQGGDTHSIANEIIHGSGVYISKGKVMQLNLRKDGLLLSSGKVTVVHAILREIHKAGLESFRKRERAMANICRLESAGFRDKETVLAVMRKFLPEVLGAFDNEVSYLLGKLQKLLISAPEGANSKR